ncbi:hypothetical protein BDZ97DRAFT_202382 [Flammula alnicola]|nr:hypothetical protein BDZ97DRAFT_202382 [Flammula alnicola]
MSQLVKGILPHEHPSSSDASSVPVAMVDLVPRRRESVNSTRVAGDVCPAEDAKIAANDIVGQGSSSSAVQTGTSSTTHVDKGKAVDPRERNGIGVDEKDSTFERDVGEPIELSVLDPRNGAEKRESRSARPQVELDAEAHHIIEVPSSQPTEPITSDLIKGKTTDPHQKGSSYLFQDDSKANYRNSQRRYTLNDQNTYPPDEPPLPVSATLWFPKITPFRLINLVVPAVLGTSKAIASQRGGTALPITLEWISGIVVFLILTMTGTYESKSYHELPWYLSWLFRTDCMDTFWRLLEFFSIERPRYAFDECSEDHSGHIVTSYRLLVTGAAAMFGVTKASLSYSGFSSGSNWVDWCYGVVATSG